MKSLSRTRTTALVLGALVVLSALGYWSYTEYRKRALHTTVVKLVTDTSAQLRDALRSEGGAPAADPLGRARALDDQATEVDARLAALRRMNAAPNRPLFDAAELYIITAREVLRREAAHDRCEVALAASRKTLLDLLQAAGRRSESWIGRTMQAKEQFEKDAVTCRLALDAIASLLASLAEPRAQLAPDVNPALMLEEDLRAKGEEQARNAAKRATAEVEETRRFAALH